MTLVEAEFIEQIEAALTDLECQRMSGGSAANSLYAAQGFGASTFYSCKVADDPTGAHFLSDLAEADIDVNAGAREGDGPSGRCLILITPDAERSMNTFLGVSSQLSVADIEEAALARARYFYVEGYLASNPISTDAAVACHELASDEGVETAISLSDPSIVQLFKPGVARMLGQGVDQIFCNEEEALSWAGTDRLDVAIAELRDMAQRCNITLGSRGEHGRGSAPAKARAWSPGRRGGYERCRGHLRRSLPCRADAGCGPRGRCEVRQPLRSTSRHPLWRTLANATRLPTVEARVYRP